MRAWLLLSCLASGLALGCAGDPGETAVELADFAAYQRDSVTTRVILPDDELGVRLATNGWQLERRRNGPAILKMRQDRARLWFFSAAGDTRGAEFRGGLGADSRERGRRVLYRLNGQNAGFLTLLPQSGLHLLEFEPASVRRGWNALELRVRRIPGDQEPTVRMKSLTFLHGDRPAEPRARVRRIETADGGLRMPAGSLLDAVFEVPPGGRFSGRVTAEAPAGDRTPIRVALALTDDSGADTELLGVSVAAGESEPIEHDLSDWQGQLVRVRATIAGASGATAVWHEARVAADAVGRAEPFERLIRPTRPDSDRKLGRPDVIVILLDAARADAFSPWGGPYPTPALEALAAGGTRFERALAPSSWTGQSVPAIFTGFAPDTVGVHQWGDELTAEVPTLAELFDRAGYHTVLWSHHPLYSRGPTIARGFESATFAGTDDLSALPEAADLFVDDRPSFAFVHLLPPHTPYTPPEPFRHRYTRDYDGWVPESLEIVNRYPRKRNPRTLAPADRKYVRDRYQEHVAFADHLVGRLIDRLRDAGRYDQALIAVISDHGEAFLEHGSFGHCKLIYREFVHVPLVIKWPASVEGHRATIAQPVSLVDLAPTLASGLDLQGAERGFQGIDLLPVVYDGARPERALYAVTRGDGVSQRLPKRWLRWERDGWGLIWHQLSGEAELFDLTDDPGEQRDLASERPTLALALLQELQMQYFFNQSLLGLEERDLGDLDPELARELEALGYL